MFIMGVVGMLSRQRHAVFLTDCSLEHEWLYTQDNAAECFYSLEYIEAAFPFTEEIIGKVKVCGMLITGVVRMLSRQKHVVFLTECSLEH